MHHNGQAGVLFTMNATKEMKNCSTVPSEPNIINRHHGVGVEQKQINGF